MVEIAHRQPEPTELAQFRAGNPNAGPADFDSENFQPVKRLVKRKLNRDQDGLCAYCESLLVPEEGQIDHIKPKQGLNGHPHLTFDYSNYAHSCVNPNHCGQRKGDRIIPVEPRSGCNARFLLNTDGSIEPDEKQKDWEDARLTRDLLNLNDPELQRKREKWVESALSLLVESEAFYWDFVQDKSQPFRCILLRLFP
ncbi:MAG: retron system putative HNH endonuclease [Verrucomicrobiota bacterium]